MRVSRFGLGSGLVAAIVAWSIVTPAAACLPPMGPPPTEAEIRARSEQAQSALWAEAPLVIEARVVRINQPDWGGNGALGDRRVVLEPTRVLKGAGRAGRIVFRYPALQEGCVGGRSGSMNPEIAPIGTVFVVYARNGRPRSRDDAWGTWPSEEITDVGTLTALNDPSIRRLRR